jgi:hypothetical protein
MPPKTMQQAEAFLQCLTEINIDQFVLEFDKSRASMVIDIHRDMMVLDSMSSSSRSDWIQFEFLREVARAGK